MRSRRRPVFDEEGSLTAFTVLLCTAMAALLGLVTEGGQVLSAREQAMSEAEQAARAGASVVSASTLHGGLLLDRSDSPALAAEEVMAADGHQGTASSSNGTVTATVTPFAVQTPLLILVGLPSIDVTASATARAVAG